MAAARGRREHLLQWSGLLKLNKTVKYTFSLTGEEALANDLSCLLLGGRGGRPRSLLLLGRSPPSSLELYIMKLSSSCSSGPNEILGLDKDLLRNDTQIKYQLKQPKGSWYTLHVTNNSFHCNDYKVLWSLRATAIPCNLLSSAAASTISPFQRKQLLQIVYSGFQLRNFS